MDKRKVTQIDYTNWRGERRVREIYPTGYLEFSNTEYHPETQWLIEAVDVEDGKVKLFALKDIHSFGATEPASPWRDIESAPRDGTWIFIYKDSWHGAIKAKWSDVDDVDGSVKAWVFQDEFLCVGVAEGCLGYNEDIEDGNMPSHWTPTPNPPR